jgi:hypothetical protein
MLKPFNLKKNLRAFDLLSKSGSRISMKPIIESIGLRIEKTIWPGTDHS